MQLEQRKHDVVQLPNLAGSNRYRRGGLSFQLVTTKALALDSYVMVDDLAFRIDNIEMAYEDCEWGDALLYTCAKSGRSVDDGFDLRTFNGSDVVVVTDKDELAKIRRVASYC